MMEKKTKITLSKLLDHHGLLRNIPASPVTINGTQRKLNNIEGVTYTSHETVIGEKLRELLVSSSDRTATIIHDGDQDGIVAGYVLENFLVSLGFEVSMHEIAHGSSFKDQALKVIGQESNAFTFVLDHSFDPAIYDAVRIRSSKLVWIDHHPLIGDCEVDTEDDVFMIEQAYSTAELVYRLVNTMSEKGQAPGYYTELICYLTHFHDTWQYKKGDGPRHTRLCKEASEFSSWFSLETESRKIMKAMLSWHSVITSTAEAFSSIANMGNAIVSSRKLMAKQIIASSCQFFEWKYGDHVYKIACVMHSDGRSKLAEAMLDAFAESGVNTALVVFFSATDQKMRFSLRSNQEGPPVDEVCRHLGGGGHRSASGFAVSPEHVGSYLQNRHFKSEK